jgi:hypothetical protein
MWKVWLRRLAFAVWGVATMLLVFEVANLSDMLSDFQVGADDTEHSNDILRGLVVPLAATMTKKDLIVRLRRLAPDEMVVETDSSVAVGQLTFRFNAAGVVDTVLPEYTP